MLAFLAPRVCREVEANVNTSFPVTTTGPNNAPVATREASTGGDDSGACTELVPPIIQIDGTNPWARDVHTYMMLHIST